MIFKRRDTVGFSERVRAFVAPRKGWRRGFAYVGQRVRRLPDTPHAIALGFALGAFMSFTPFFFLHLPIALAMAWALRANLFATVAGTTVGNGLTLPAIAAASLTVGGWITGRDGLAAAFDFDRLTADFRGVFVELFAPYLIGGSLVGLAFAGGSYAMIRPLVAAYQAARRRKLVERARARVAEHLRRGPIKNGTRAPDPSE